MRHSGINCWHLWLSWSHNHSWLLWWCEGGGEGILLVGGLEVGQVLVVSGGFGVEGGFESIV